MKSDAGMWTPFAFDHDYLIHIYIVSDPYRLARSLVGRPLGQCCSLSHTLWTTIAVNEHYYYLFIYYYLSSIAYCRKEKQAIVKTNGRRD